MRSGTTASVITSVTSDEGGTSEARHTRNRAVVRGRMRLSMAPTSVSGHGESEEGAESELHGAVWRRLVLGLTLVLMLGCVATLISPSTKAGANTGTVFATGQVFASVGLGQVNIYDPTSGNQ